MNDILRTGQGNTDEKTIRVTLAADSPGTGGSAPTGGATSALQTAGNTSLTNLNTAIGTTADSVAASDTATATIIAFIKRLAAGITSLITNTTLTKGGGAMDSTTARVTLATDGPGVSNLSTIATQTTTTNTNLGAQADAAATTDSGTFSIIAFIKRMMIGITDLQEGVQALENTLATTTAGISTVQTSATGTNWVALGSNVANRVIFNNATGTTMSIRYGSGTAISLLNNQSITINLPTGGTLNSNQIQVQRSDQSNTQVTLGFIYESQA